MCFKVKIEGQQKKTTDCLILMSPIAWNCFVERRWSRKYLRWEWTWSYGCCRWNVAPLFYKSVVLEKSTSSSAGQKQPGQSKNISMKVSGSHSNVGRLEKYSNVDSHIKKKAFQMWISHCDKIRRCLHCWRKEYHIIFYRVDEAH